jgi:hypothetical protein
MFLHLMRALEKFQESMREEHAQLRVQFRALESRLDALSATGPPPAGKTAPEENPLVLEPQDPLETTLEDPVMSFEPRR